MKLFEVGSGLGLVANAAPTTAVATDHVLPESKQLLQVETNGRLLEGVSWSRVDWHASDSSATILQPFGPLDLIVSADIII